MHLLGLKRKASNQDFAIILQVGKQFATANSLFILSKMSGPIQVNLSHENDGWNYHTFTLQNTNVAPSFNPPVTARVKISQNVDYILAKVYLVHLKVKHCQTLRVVSTFTGQNELTVFLTGKSTVLFCWRWSK